MEIKTDYSEGVEDFKNKMRNFAKEIIINEQEFHALIIIYCKNSNGEDGLGISPVGHFMQDRDSKEAIKKEVIPRLLKAAEEKDQTPICLCLITEAWAYIGEGKNINLSNYKTLPKKEVLLLSFETEFTNVKEMYDIKRDENKKVIDIIKSEKDITTNGEGTFANLFKKQFSKN